MIASYEQEEKMVKQNQLPAPFYYLDKKEEEGAVLDEVESTLESFDIHSHPAYLALQTTLNASQERLSILEMELKGFEELKNTNRELQLQFDDLESVNRVLEERVGRGEFDASKVKVLHMSSNPTYEMIKQACDKKCSALEVEVSNLKFVLEQTQQELAKIENYSVSEESKKEYDPSQLQVVGKLQILLAEERKRHSELEGSLKNRVSNLESQVMEIIAEKESLLKQIANQGPESEKKYQRFKELFTTMFGQYKEAVYLLTGYKIERVGQQNLYRVRPIFADSSEDQLLFQITDSYWVYFLHF